MAKIEISTLLHVLHVWSKIQNFWHERKTWLYLLAAFWKNSKTYFTTDFWPPRNRKNGRFQIFVFLDFIGISIWNWNFQIFMGVTLKNLKKLSKIYFSQKAIWVTIRGNFGLWIRFWHSKNHLELLCGLNQRITFSSIGFY